MAATASALPPLSPKGVGSVDQEDSNISSPLSEVDDKDDNDDEIEHMQLDHDDEPVKAAEESKKGPNNISDSDSVLSDAHSEVNSDGNDTDAETERLYDTPQHQRQRDVVLNQFNEGQIFEHTPSKLRKTTDLVNTADDESLSDDDASIGSSHPDLVSPIKPVIAKSTSIVDEHKSDSQERKRKRSPGADQSEAEQPLRKRTSSLVERETAVPQQDEDTVMREDEAIPSHEVSGSHSPIDNADQPALKQASYEDDIHEPEMRTIKKGTRGSRRKVVGSADVNPTIEIDAIAGPEAEHAGDGTDPDVDEEADATTAHDEECRSYLSKIRNNC